MCEVGVETYEEGQTDMTQGNVRGIETGIRRKKAALLLSIKTV
jgi:hypothetical protein